MPEFTPSSQQEGQALPANSGDTLSRIGTLKNFERDLKQSTTHFQKWKVMAKRYYRTYGGDPWTEADREHLESTERPPITLNFSLNTINMLVGEDINQRREARFEGVDGDARDSFIADCLTRLHRYLFNKCDGYRSDSHVYHDGLITGLGFSRTYLDNTRWPFRFRVAHINPWQCHPDPDAKDDNLTDSRFIIYESKWTKEEVRARWGDKIATTIAASTPSLSTGTPKTVSHDNYQTSSPDSGDNDIAPKLTIYEYCYTKFEPWVAFTNPQTQQDETLPEDEFKKNAEAGAYGQVEVLAAGYAKKVYKRAWISAAKNTSDRNRILEDLPLSVDRFPISIYTGYRKTDVDTGRVLWFGLMHVIYEPQLLSSKVLTTIVEIMARSAKGGVFFESGAVEDPDEFKHSFAIPGAAIQVEDGGLAKIELRDTVKMPSGMAQLLEIARGGIEDVSAVTRAMTGTMTSERSNVLISNMQTQSLTVLAPATDPLSGFRMQQGLTLTQQAVQHLSVEAIDKILGPITVAGITHQEDPNMPGELMVNPQDGQPIVIQTPGQILKETDIFEYHVQVDTGSASPTVKQAFFALMFQHGFLQELAKIGVPMDQLIPDIFKFSPLPPEMSKPLAAKLKASLSAPKPEQIAAQLAKLPPDQQQQVMQMVMQGQGGGNGKPPQGQQPPQVQ